MSELGHNNPPSEEEQFRDEVKGNSADISKRINDLLVGTNKVPETVDDDNASRVTDFIGQCKKALKDAEARRKELKEPHDKRGKIVQAFYKGLTNPLQDSVGKVEKRLAKYNSIKAEEARKKREEEERKAREAEQKRIEAEERRRQAEEAAAKAESEAEREDAAKQFEEAADLESQADAQEQSFNEAKKGEKEARRTKGDFGSTAYSRKVTKFEVVNPEKVPLKYLMPDEQAIRAAIKDGVQEIPGVRIYEDETFVVKGG